MGIPQGPGVEANAILGLFEHLAMLLGLSLPWNANVTHYRPDTPCPVCTGRWLDYGDVCLVCHRSGKDNRLTPMRYETAANPITFRPRVK